ncbi:outer membrane protein assembly factor BamC [Methylotenera versatilis]|uniref:outer membrane protein assembly factor BamC n=1 Tax=Methylotenera versatilis TaxID=1055487 RepID=UPI0006491620|nr:outer membrane protein assembly factor BamC [Methylotenera versatilis]
MVVINMKQAAKFTTGVLLAVLVTACDSIPFIDTSSDYKGAGRAKPLEVPPDLTSVQTSDAYNVPGGSTSYSTYNQGQEGQEVGVEKILPTSDGVRLEKAGAQRWLVVNAPAEKIWPAVREFWIEQGFAVRVENAQTGVMETEWIEADAIKAQDDKKNIGEKFDKWMDKLSGLADRRKFRTRLERGEKEGSTEIYMTHRTVSGAPDDGKNRVQTQLGEIDTGYRADTTQKVAEEKDGDLDAELLRRLMVKLGIEEKRAQEIVANPVTEKRAEVVKEADSSVTLNLNDPFDRGWRRVGLALDRIGFVTEDKDRSTGTFFVRYSDVDIDTGPKKKKGLLDTLAFWKDDDEIENKSKPKEEKTIVDKMKFWKGEDGKTDPSKQYHIKLVETENGETRVNVVDAEGNRNRSTTANRIISLLYDQLK